MGTYGTRAPTEVSWFRPHLDTSLALLVIVAAFGPEGPSKCSGVGVMRYDAGWLHAEFGAHFRLMESSKELHDTSFGTTQQFVYCYCIAE